jgi:selenocysteine-specific elongation factor
LTAERIQALAGAVDSRSFERIEGARVELHGAIPNDPPAGPQPAAKGLVMAADVSESLVATVLEAVAAHHRAAPLSPGLPLPRARAVLLRRLRALASVDRQHLDATNAISDLLDDLVAAGRLARRGDVLRDPALATEASPDLLSAMDRLEAALAVAAPPSLDAAAAAAACPPEGIRELQAAGRIVRLAPDLAWSTATYHGLAAVALERARAHPLTPAAFRDATGTSRKFVLAILEDLDRRGVLQRTPEGHVPGPRAPAPDRET